MKPAETSVLCIQSLWDHERSFEGRKLALIKRECTYNVYMHTLKLSCSGCHSMQASPGVSVAFSETGVTSCLDRCRDECRGA